MAMPFEALSLGEKTVDWMHKNAACRRLRRPDERLVGAVLHSAA